MQLNELREIIYYSLKAIGIDDSEIEELRAGGTLYGDCGLLDSILLVALTATISDEVGSILSTPFDLFEELDSSVIDAFSKIDTLACFLANRLNTKDAGGYNDNY